MYRTNRPDRGDRRKIIFLVTEDWYFMSHRLPLARACRDLGWEVIVATRIDRYGEAIRAEGFKIIPIRLRRKNLRLWGELRSIFELIAIFARERPSLIHQIGLKPVIFGSLAAMVVRTGPVVNALAGMGYIFTSGRILVRIARSIIKFVLRMCLSARDHWVIVQNNDDASLLMMGCSVKPERIRVIKGSGVDIDQFAPTPEPAEPVVATVVSRMLKDKGIREVVLAARELKRRGSKVEIRFVGAPDAGNPTSISKQTLDQWNKEGCIRWLGHQENVAAMWSMAHIAVLPSYREGMPMSLLEAAACGRPIVTTDVQGCNEFVEDGVNGFLIPVNDWIKLADSIETLAASPELRTRFGAAARMKVEAGYDEQTVVDQTVAFYMKTLDGLGPDVAVSTPDSLRP